ncbi:unnamed protein product [Rhodiola kirilowii]
MKAHHGSFYPLMLCTFLLLLCCFQRSAAQEAEDDREFDHIKLSKKGPENWGNLKNEWSLCKDGKSQSPIDLSSKGLLMTSELGRLRTRYRACNATLKNRGHDIAVEWDGDGDAGWFRTNRTRYKLKQTHWHSPSEHTVNGKRYAMELHMVHKTDDPKARHKAAVVSSLYEIGRPDPFLSKLMKNVTTLTSDDDEDALRDHMVVNPNDINVNGMRYFRYIGSLTIPPCTEGVLWTINNRVKTVSKAQLTFLKEVVHDYAKNNARPVQPLNGRRVYFNTPRARSS